MKEETQNWLAMADTDLAAAEALLERGLYPPVVFHCQQAVEKYLKAAWIEAAAEGSPPRIHDLVALARLLEVQLTPQQLDFLARLSEQYAPTCYVDQPADYSREATLSYLGETKEFCTWLRRQMS